jgi:hypothetical protein
MRDGRIACIDCIGSLEIIAGDSPLSARALIDIRRSFNVGSQSIRLDSDFLITAAVLPLPPRCISTSSSPISLS